MPALTEQDIIGLGLSAAELNAAGIRPGMDKAEVVRLLNTTGVKPPTFEEETASTMTAARTALSEGRPLDALGNQLMATEFLPGVSAIRGKRIGSNILQTLGGAAETGLGLATKPEARAKALEQGKAVAGAAMEDPGGFLGSMGTGLLERGKAVINDPIQAFEDEPIGSVLDLMPLASARRALGAGARGATKFAAEEGLTGAAGFLSRQGKDAFKEGLEAVAEGGARGKAFRATQRGAMEADEVAEGVRSAAFEMKHHMSQDFREGIQTLMKDAAPLKFKMKEMVDEVSEKVKGYGVDPDALASGKGDAFLRFGSEVSNDQRLVSEAYALVKGWTDNSVEGLHILKQKLRSKIGEGKLLGATQGEAAVADIWKSVRERLGSVKGYDALNESFEEGMNLLEEMAQSLSLKAGTETVMRKLAQVFRDPTAYKVRAKLVQELQDVSGVPFKAQLAGLATSGWMPKGTGAFMATILATGGLGTPKLLALMPFTSPRLMGEMVGILGASEKAVHNVERWMEMAGKTAKAMNVSTEGATVAMVLERMRQRGNSGQAPADVLTTLGTPQR